MASLIMLTKMESGHPVMVSMHGVKFIEDTTFEPKVAKIPEPKEGPAPATTQPVSPAPPVVAVPPVVCSMIWFHDDKTMVVKEAMSEIMRLAAISNT
jgi:hypothetical protein